MSAKVPQDPAKGKVSIDRLLEAAAPGLSTELDRMVDEFRATLEAEAKVRLKKALLDKDAEHRTHAAQEDRRIRAATEQTVRADVTALLEARFKKHLAAELDGLRRTHENEAAEVAEQRMEEAQRWNNERTDLIAVAERWHVWPTFNGASAMHVRRPRFYGASWPQRITFPKVRRFI